jgi:hypothetical protein
MVAAFSLAMSVKSDEYRNKSLEYLAMAKDEPVEELRNRLLALARSFQELAEQLDRLDELTPGRNGAEG